MLDTNAIRAQHPAMDIKTALQTIGWTNRELARRRCVSENQVRRWVAGARVPADLIDCLAALTAFHKKNPIPAKNKR